MRLIIYTSLTNWSNNIQIQIELDGAVILPIAQSIKYSLNLNRLALASLRFMNATGKLAYLIIVSER